MYKTCRGRRSRTNADDGEGLYRWYVDHRWLQRRFIVPIFICFFLLVLYLLGKFLAAGVGRFFWNQFESGSFIACRS